MKKSRKKDIILLFFLYFSLLPAISTSLNAVELRFKEGNIYFATLMNETEKTIKVSYMNEIYEVPKTDLEFYDVSKKGRNESYKVSKVTLRDGSSIKGIYVEENENEFILKTELGFLNLKKTSINPPFPKKEDSPEFPRKYLFEEVKNPETRIGISTPFHVFIPPLSQNTVGLVGVSLFIEPAFVQWRAWMGGFRMELLQSVPKSSLQIAQSSFYAIHPFWDSEDKYHHLFYGLSLGLANLQYKVPTGSGDTRSGLNPFTTFELMYEYSGWSSLFLRSSLKSNFYLEPKEVIPSLGIEFSAGVRL
ncbi:MAG: hypothetical protein MH321_06110 [Leptospiraceae bacterium]|nr:hypothetical protein [Leptospiraceae bacterium]